MESDVGKIRNGDLYALLALCNKEDLNPLVEAILGRFTNFLRINEDYKKFNPEHTKYYKAIGDEFRQFGGHSIRNLFRGGQGPSYDEIVIDVCKKLDVPYKGGDTLNNESNLLDIFIERRWNSLTIEERETLAAEARKAAVDKVSTIIKIPDAGVAVKGAALAIIRFGSGPAGWSLLGLSMFDAAFKVTVPCVLHLAYMRRKILAELKERELTSLPILLPNLKKQASSPQPNALIIAEHDSAEPILTLARIPEPTGGVWRKIDRSDDGISRLNPLLQVTCL